MKKLNNGNQFMYQVAMTSIDGYDVSTVYIPSMDEHREDGPVPFIARSDALFETMVFEVKADGKRDYTERYGSRRYDLEDAFSEHQRIVREIALGYMTFEREHDHG